MTAVAGTNRQPGVRLASSAATPDETGASICYLGFAHDFEHGFVHQGGDRRTIEQTLEATWQLLLGLPAADL